MSGAGKRMTFSNPNFSKLPDQIKASAARKLPMVMQGCHADAPGFVVCGTAGSLIVPENLAEVKRLSKAGWIVIGLKEALNLLRDNGIKCHYTVAMDPDAKQIEKTPLIEGVTYCIASSCSPALYDHILSAGLTVLVFHSACGVEGEMDLYKALFGKGDVVMGGYTLANRASGLAKYMGGPQMPVAVAGVQFGWRDGQNYYADGVTGKPGNAGSEFDDGGKIDGKVWHTKLDLMASAVHMARQVKQGLISFIGESLAKSLATHPDAFLERVCKKETMFYAKPRVMVSNKRALVRAVLYEMGETLPVIEGDEELAA